MTLKTPQTKKREKYSARGTSWSHHWGVRQTFPDPSSDGGCFLASLFVLWLPVYTVRAPGAQGKYTKLVNGGAADCRIWQPLAVSRTKWTAVFWGGYLLPIFFLSPFLFYFRFSLTCSLHISVIWRMERIFFTDTNSLSLSLSLYHHSWKNTHYKLVSVITHNFRQFISFFPFLLDSCCLIPVFINIITSLTLSEFLWYLAHDKAKMEQILL